MDILGEESITSANRAWAALTPEMKAEYNEKASAIEAPNFEDMEEVVQNKKIHETRKKIEKLVLFVSAVNLERFCEKYLT